MEVILPESRLSSEGEPRGSETRATVSVQVGDARHSVGLAEEKGSRCG